MSILINETERYITHCEFKIHSAKDSNFIFDIQDFVQFILNNYWKKPYFLNHKTEAYRILRARLINNRYLIIFMQYTNQNASDPAFARLQNGKSRIVRKNIGEGVACSAHLVIDTQNTTIPNRFNAILEDMQGLSRKKICALLNHILSTYKIQDPNNKKITHRPLPILTFYAKNNFEEQLSSGQLEEAVAYKEELQLSPTMDDDAMTISYKEINTLKFKIPSSISSSIKAVAQIAKISREKGYSKIKITHKENKKEQSADYILKNNMDYETMLEDIRLTPFISKKRIELANPIGICNHKWNSQLIRSMIDSLN